MFRAVANTLLPAARPASTIARPRPRELPVTNHTCAIHPPLSSHPRIFWRSFSNSGLDAQWVYERTCFSHRHKDVSDSKISRLAQTTSIRPVTVSAISLHFRKLVVRSLEVGSSLFFSL